MIAKIGTIQKVKQEPARSRKSIQLGAAALDEGD